MQCHVLYLSNNIVHLWFKVEMQSDCPGSINIDLCIPLNCWLRYPESWDIYNLFYRIQVPSPWTSHQVSLMYFLYIFNFVINGKNDQLITINVTLFTIFRPPGLLQGIEGDIIRVIRSPWRRPVRRSKHCEKSDFYCYQLILCIHK